jgi:hypothetical protein
LAAEAQTVVSVPIPFCYPPRQEKSKSRHKQKGDLFSMAELRIEEGRVKESLAFIYNDTLGALVVEAVDAENLFPLYIKVEAGLYKIQKNKTGTLQMGK